MTKIANIAHVTLRTKRIDTQIDTSNAQVHKYAMLVQRLVYFITSSGRSMRASNPAIFRKIKFFDFLKLDLVSRCAMGVSRGRPR